MRRVCFASALAFGCCVVSAAQTLPLVNCPAGRVYRDNRKVDGQVFCELELPGSLTVKDGPFRFWFNPEFEGMAGSYIKGRETGYWKECDRFRRCSEKDYPRAYPEELRRPEFKDQIPVSYASGKYTFDFASCRNTRIENRQAGTPGFELNIASELDACTVARNSIPIVGVADYVCKVPFRAGVMTFDSLDLLKALPRYCTRRNAAGTVAPNVR